MSWASEEGSEDSDDLPCFGAADDIMANIMGLTEPVAPKMSPPASTPTKPKPPAKSKVQSKSVSATSSSHPAKSPVKGEDSVDGTGPSSTCKARGKGARIPTDPEQMLERDGFNAKAAVFKDLLARSCDARYQGSLNLADKALNKELRELHSEAAAISSLALTWSCVSHDKPLRHLRIQGWRLLFEVQTCDAHSCACQVKKLHKDIVTLANSVAKRRCTPQVVNDRIHELRGNVSAFMLLIMSVRALSSL